MSTFAEVWAQIRVEMAHDDDFWQRTVIEDDVLLHRDDSAFYRSRQTAFKNALELLRAPSSCAFAAMDHPTGSFQKLESIYARLAEACRY
jgi:hypothetical protein